jgi:hypothetical protein
MICQRQASRFSVMCIMRESTKRAELKRRSLDRILDAAGRPHWITPRARPAVGAQLRIFGVGFRRRACLAEVPRRLRTRARPVHDTDFSARIQRVARETADKLAETAREDN